MAKRIGAKTTEVRGSHVVFLTQPDAVASSKMQPRGHDGAALIEPEMGLLFASRPALAPGAGSAHVGAKNVGV